MMHAYELLELSGLLATQSRFLVSANTGFRGEGLEQYWIRSKCRLDRWGLALTAHATQTQHDGTNSNESWSEVRPVIEEILDVVHGAGKGNISPQRVGTIYYNRGVIAAIITVEAIRTAQGKFGKKPLTGEQVRWGIENLNITNARIKELGAKGLMVPLKVSCRDHEGGGAVKFQQWTGTKWKVITDWIQPDRKLLRPLIEASAAKYAKEKGITPRSGMSLGSQC